MSVTNYERSRRETAPIPELNGRPRGGGSGSARWLPIAIIVVLVVAGLALRMRSQKAATGTDAATGNAAGKAPIETVRAVPVKVGTIQQTLEITGTLRSNQSVDISSKIQGRVSQVYVKEGDRINRGQLLIALDDEDLHAQLAAAQAQLRQTQVRYQQTVVGLPAREQQVATSLEQAQSALQQARARYQQALLNEPARIQNAQSQVETAQQGVTLAESRVKQARDTAQQTKEQVESEVERAQAALAAAQANLAEVKRGARDQQIAQAQAQVTLQDAQLRDAETELRRAKTLVEGGAAPQSQVDAATTRYNVAKAQLESAQQNLSLVKEGATNEQVRQAQEAVRQAEAGVSNATAGRQRVLVAQGEITNAIAAQSQAQAALQSARANLADIPVTRQETRVAREGVDTAQATLNQARANRSQIPMARQDVQAAAATVGVAKAAVQQAQVTLRYARIYSPVNGVVNTKYVGAGQAVGPGVALLNLVALDSVYFEAQVSQENLRQIEINQETRVSLPSVSSQPLQGFVSDIIPVADPKLRQFRIRVTIPRSPRELTPGAFARGVLVTKDIAGAMLVPADAVQDLGTESIVFVVQNIAGKDQVKRRKVMPGTISGDTMQILGGVKPGELVVVGNNSLEDGTPVKVAKATA